MSTQDLTLAMKFTATDKGLSGKLNLTKEQLEQLNKAQRDNVTSANQSTASNQRFQKSLFALKAGAAAVVTGLAAVSLKTIAVARETERMEAQLRTMTGSSEAAGQAFDRLNEFAKQTPFTLQQSIDGFVKLKALGLDPSERAMKSYGNTASAMGKDMNQMIEAVADASTFEFERLKEFGIKTRQEGDNVTFTFRGVETTIQKSSANIQEYLLGIGETHFGEAMANQMDTIDGKFSNLEQTVDDFFRVLGDDSIAMDVFRDAIDWVTEAIDNATTALKYFKSELKAEAIVENAENIARAVHNIEMANLNLSKNLNGRRQKAESSRLKENLKQLEELGLEYLKLHKTTEKVTVSTDKHNKASQKLGTSLKDNKDKLEDMTGPLSDYLQLFEDGERLALSLRTEQEQLTDSLGLYAAMLQVGAVNQETYNRAVVKAIDDFNQASKKTEQQIKKVKEQANPFAIAWENTIKRLDDGFANMWEDFIDGSDSAMDFVKDAAKKWLAEMLHMLTTQRLVASFGFATSPGVAQAGMAGTASQLGGLSNLYSVGSSAFDLVNSGMGSSVLGVAGSTGAFMASGAGYSQAAMLAAQTAEFGAAGTMATTSALGGGSALGAIGAAVPYIAAALAVAGLLGAFDSDSDTTPDLRIGASTAAPFDTPLIAQGGEAWGTIQSQFGNINYGTKHDAFPDPADAQAFSQSLINQFVPFDQIIADTIGEELAATVVKGMESFSLEQYVEEGQEFESAVSTIFSARFNAIADIIGGEFDQVFDLFENDYKSGVVAASAYISATDDVKTVLMSFWTDQKTTVEELVGENETLVSASIRLIGQLDGVNAQFNALGLSLYDVSAESAFLADDLIAAAGGLDALNAKTAFYYDRFFSAEEQRNHLIELASDQVDQFNDTWSEFGVVTLGSNDSLRTFIDGLDLTTQAGINAYNAALNLAPALNESSLAIEQVMNTFDEAMANITQSAASSSEKWILDTYTDKQTSDYYSQQAVSSFNQLQSSTDKDEIQALTNTLFNLGDKMWALLDPEMKAGELQGYLDAAALVESTAQAQLELAQSNEIDFTPMENAMSDAADASATIKDAATIMAKAAAVIEKAANTPQDVRIEVDMPDKEVGHA